MRLVLVRHAEAEESARGRCYGSLDVGLSETGRAQCSALARRLVREEAVAIVSSPRRRALETAEAISVGRTAVRTDARLAELDFGELEGRSYDEIAASLPDLYEAWMTRPTDVQFPGGERYADLEARVLDAVSALRSEFDQRTVVAVTHGGGVRAVLRGVLSMPQERIFRISVEPASLSVVEWIDGEPIVRSVNERVVSSE